MNILKRDGQTLQPFNIEKIQNAIRGAWIEVHGTSDEETITDITDGLYLTLNGGVVDVETIQDAVEVALMRAQEFAVAKAYIVFRDKRSASRQADLHPDPLAVSEYIHASKYARHVPELGRRELYDETVARVEMMHQRKFAHLPEMRPLISGAFDLVRDKRVLPSMRAMQFGGAAIEANHNRLYNCLSEDTAFVTLEGVRRFSDFRHGDTTTVLTHTGAWKKAVVKSYGEQQLFDVAFKRGSGFPVVRATREHQWVLTNQERTTDLQIGDTLSRPPVMLADWKYEEVDPEQRWYWAMGYVFGDGTCVKDEKGEHKYSMVRLCGDEGKYLKRFQELGFATSKPASCNGDAMAYTGKYLKTTPSITTDGLKNVTAFVRGYLDADGAKNPNWYKNPEGSFEFLSIQASGAKHINFIREVFPCVGVYIVSERDLTGQVTNFGTRPLTVSFRITGRFGSRRDSSYVVNSITRAGVETVWCLEVEEDHSFVLANGVVTGNCSASLVDRPRIFAEAMFLLLCGCGVGYSVQFDHVEKLPSLVYIDPKRVVHHVIADSIEGWADAVDALVTSYFTGDLVEFAFNEIRDAGVPLKTSGGRAPGHLKLKLALERVRTVLHGAQGRQLRPIECHRIMCHIADAVLSGGIRRSAMICLFSLDDSEMMNCKSDSTWFDKEPWFANANNSVVLKRDEITRKQFDRIFSKTRHYGEPGFFFVEDYNHVTNPCAEILLDPVFVQEDGTRLTGWAMCNLCEINAAKLTSIEDFIEVAKAATLIGTLQASYTDMPYLGKVTEQIVRRDALLGIGMTGMQDCPAIACDPKMQEFVANIITVFNEKYAGMIDINTAARTTCVKPSGTTSLELGSVASGIHPHHAKRYIRRVTADELELVFQAFKAKNPKLCTRKPDGKWVIEFPVEAPEGATLREHLSALEFLEVVRSTQLNWVQPGTVRGTANHNVSNTITVREDEWETVADYLWKYRNDFAGVSLLSDLGDQVYAFAPFESVKTATQMQRWNELIASYTPVDYQGLMESEDGTSLSGELACAGGACLI